MAGKLKVLWVTLAFCDHFSWAKIQVVRQAAVTHFKMTKNLFVNLWSIKSDLLSPLKVSSDSYK